MVHDTRARPTCNEASAAHSLRLAEWPVSERAAWELARAPRRRFSHPRLGDATCNDLVRRYGQFLNYCNRTGRLDECADPGTLVTQSAIAGFVSELQSRVGSVTVAQSVYKVCRAARLIAPARDFSWLSEIAQDLALLAEPMNKSARVVMTERLVEAGLTLVGEAALATSRPLLIRSLMARNGLMVALLAVCPIRLKNFAALEIGRSFRQLNGSWWIVLRNTKSRRPDERPIPDYLHMAIQQYLEIHRYALLACGGVRGKLNHTEDSVLKREGALWVSRLGTRLSYGQVGRAISETTRATIGTDVSPHLIRASAATTAALYAGDMLNLASALLQHTRAPITEEHYNRANSLSVAVQFAQIVRAL
jgi:integrase